MKIRLRVRPSPTESFDWEHPGPKIGIGKEGCQLVFHGESSVSRRHAEIELLASGAVLRDDGSKNGTYVNGTPLTGAVILTAGDEVSLGQGGPRFNVLSIDLATTGHPTFPNATSKKEPALEAAALGTPRPSALSTPASPMQAASGSTPATTLPTAPGLHMLRAELRGETSRKMVTAIGVAALFGLLLLTIIVIAAWKMSGSAEAGASDTEVPAESDFEIEEESPSDAVALAPATPSPSPPVLPLPAKSLEQVVRSSESAVVWIGFEINGKQFCYATAWAIKPNVIVTTAVAADHLEQILRIKAPGEYGSATLMARDSVGAAQIREMRLHPRFDRSQPHELASVAHNIAVGILDRDLPSVCPLATNSEIGDIDVKTPLLAVGFVDDSTGKEHFDKIKKHVHLERKATRLISGEPPGADPPSNYRVKVGSSDSSSEPMEFMAGSPVFGEHGRVIGLLAIMGKSFRMIPLKNARDWLDGVPY